MVLRNHGPVAAKDAGHERPSVQGCHNDQAPRGSELQHVLNEWARLWHMFDDIPRRYQVESLIWGLHFFEPPLSHFDTPLPGPLCSRSMAPSFANKILVDQARDKEPSKRYPPSATVCVPPGLLE